MAPDSPEEAFYRLEVRRASSRKVSVLTARFAFKKRYGRWPKLLGIEQEEYRCPGHKWQTVRHPTNPRREWDRCTLCQGETGSRPRGSR